jgi:hypothetical protein
MFGTVFGCYSNRHSHILWWHLLQEVTVSPCLSVRLYYKCMCAACVRACVCVYVRTYVRLSVELLGMKDMHEI